MIFEEWYEPYGMMLQSGRDKGSLSIAWKSGAASRDAEIESLRQQIMMLRSAVKFWMQAESNYDLMKADKMFQEALAATEPKP